MARRRQDRLTKAEYMALLNHKVHRLHRQLESLTAIATPIFENLPHGEDRNRAVFELIMAAEVLENSHPESMLLRNPEVEEIAFAQDIPSKRWVAEKVRDAKDGGRNRWGVPRTFGPVTGSFSQPLWLPTSLLSPLRGERGEQDAPRQKSLEYLMENWDRVRLIPVYIEVDPFGQPWVSDGNHRIMAASIRGEPSVLAEVKYFSGSQLRVQPEWAPERLIQYHHGHAMMP